MTAGSDRKANEEAAMLFFDGAPVPVGQAVWCRVTAESALHVRFPGAIRVDGDSSGPLTSSDPTSGSSVPTLARPLTRSMKKSNFTAKSTPKPGTEDFIVPIQNTSDIAWIQRRAVKYDGVAMLAPASSHERQLLRAFEKWDKTVARIGPSARFVTIDLPGGWRFAPFDTHVAMGEGAVPMCDLQQVTLARLRLCRTLDDVLAIATPARLVQLLYGDRGAKTLVEPLADAIVRALATSEKNDRQPTMTSIALSCAAAPLVDPGRVAKILAWDDSGHNLLPPSATTDFAEDLRVAVGSYADVSRRFRLIESLWNETLSRRLHSQSMRDVLAKEMRKSSPKMSRAADELRQCIQSIGQLPEKARNLAALGLVDFFMSEYILAEAKFVLQSSRNRKVRPSTPSILRDRLGNNSGTIPALYAEVRSAVLLLEVLFQEAGQFTDSRELHKRAKQLFSDSPSPARVERLKQDLVIFLEWAMSDPMGDPDLMASSESLMLFDGLGSRCWFDEGPGYQLQTLPPPVDNLVAAAAQVAQLCRFGANLPHKPTSWSQLRAAVAGPFWRFGSVEIAVPDWAKHLHGKTVAEELEVRVPADMRELVMWADYMGNCMASLHGEELVAGTEVIVGLFRGKELIFNVSFDPRTGSVNECNSRFNNGDVPAAVRNSIQMLSAQCFRAHNDQDIGQLGRGSDVGSAEHVEGQLSFSGAITAGLEELSKHEAASVGNRHSGGGRRSGTAATAVRRILDGVTHELDAILNPAGPGNSTWTELLAVVANRVETATPIGKTSLHDNAAYRTALFSALIADEITFDIAFNGCTTHPLDAFIEKLSVQIETSKNDSRMPATAPGRRRVVRGQGGAAKSQNPGSPAKQDPLALALEVLRRARVGDPRLEVGSTREQFLNGPLNVALRFSRQQTPFREALRLLAIAELPVSAPIIRPSRHPHARWAIALLRQHAIDSGAVYPERGSTLWFDLSGERTRRAWELASAIDPKSTAALLSHCGLAGLDDDLGEASSIRLAVGRGPLQVPRGWLLN